MINAAVQRTSRAKRSPAQTTSDRPLRQRSGAVRWLGLLAFFLLAAPKLRITFGLAPLYALDVLNVVLFMNANRMPAVKWSLSKTPLPRLVSLYLVLIWGGELRGLLIYGTFLETIYLIVEFSLAISLFFTIPKLVRNIEATVLVLKGLTAGVLCASIVTILYALAPTRSLVMNTVFSYNFLVPAAESIARKTLAFGGVDEAMRGQSLIGTSTITTGFLGTVWGLTFLAANWPGITGRWRTLANIASLLTPVAMLMTYGRAAWLTVIVIGTMSFIFGFAKSRRNIILLGLTLAFVVYQVGWQSKLFMVDRVVKTTELVIENPTEEKSFAMRLESYIEPFSHLMANPLWLMVGAGRVGQKFANRGNVMAEMLDQVGISTHSGFGMAYYCYGMIAAITHALIVLNGLGFILVRLRRRPPPGVPLYKIIWQAFLMAWTGLLLWWLPGHAMIGEARGVILFFFFYGVMMACDQMLLAQANEAIRQ